MYECVYECMYVCMYVYVCAYVTYGCIICYMRGSSYTVLVTFGLSLRYMVHVATIPRHLSWASHKPPSSGLTALTSFLEEQETPAAEPPQISDLQSSDHII